ncbi:hypothetical protein PaecuDRAFT_4339 [Paenibacillus curdlanolyticus YK9]|uniref:DUF5067 domain-containing protein n=1 Tax=Paenibacillus curdlanolyticus YK9 TaxID=717606 RepID=E0IF98_9BACL|nr:hypothetical protein [Paenibacillus curdlanolyticus]EFM08874.1 hypothetical protein PaecuDRAFT_4339 [Paenibacillus curdlanolyticus YK9]
MNILSRKKEIVIIMLSFMLFIASFSIAHATDPFNDTTYKTNTQALYVYNCSDPNSATCGDHYADHFELKIYWNKISSSNSADIKHASATYTYFNQNGDEWTLQRLEIMKSGSDLSVANQVYNSYAYQYLKQTAGSSSYYETFNPNVTVPLGNNYIVGTFDIQLYTSGGSPSSHYYPRRNLKNFS